MIYVTSNMSIQEPQEPWIGTPNDLLVLVSRLLGGEEIAVCNEEVAQQILLIVGLSPEEATRRMIFAKTGVF